MPWKTWPAKAARKLAGTEIRPFLSIRFTKVSMNRAIDPLFAPLDAPLGWPASPSKS